MSEFHQTNNPSDLSKIEVEIFDSFFSHWHHYFSMPEGKRLGDEAVWEEVLKNAASEVGIDRQTSGHLSAEAKDRAISFPEFKPIIDMTSELQQTSDKNTTSSTLDMRVLVI